MESGLARICVGFSRSRTGFDLAAKSENAKKGGEFFQNFLKELFHADYCLKTVGSTRLRTIAGCS